MTRGTHTAKGKKGDKGKKKDAVEAKKEAAATTSLRLPEYSKAEAKTVKKLAGKDLFKLAAMTPKKKCCKSDIRCLRCPVVLHKLNRETKNGEVDYAALLSVVAKVRIRQPALAPSLPSGPTHEQQCRALYGTGTDSSGLFALQTPAHTYHSKYRDNDPRNSRQARKFYSVDMKSWPEPGM